MYQFFDLHLIPRIILSDACLIYHLREESQNCCMGTSLDADVLHIILGHCDLIIVSEAYLLYYLM